MKTKRPKNQVMLKAFDGDGNAVEHVTLAYDDYYDGGVVLIDSNAYRATKNIRRVQGEVYGSAGNLQQKFENEYNENGDHIKCRIIYEDGTIVERVISQ